MDCHVAVVPAFFTASDPGAARRAVVEATRGTQPFTIRTTIPEVIAGSSSATVVLPLEPSDHLANLNGRLITALGPRATFPSEAVAGAFHPYVTVAQSIPLEGVEEALKAILGWRVNYMWVVRDLHLVGLEGRRLWRSLERFDFGRPALARAPATA